MFESHRVPKSYYELPCSWWICHLSNLSISARTNVFYLFLNPTDFSLYSCQPLELLKAHPPKGTKEHPIFLLLQSLWPTAPACSLCSWENPPMWPQIVCGVLLSRLQVYMLNKLLSISFVQCIQYLILFMEDRGHLSHQWSE